MREMLHSRLLFHSSLYDVIDQIRAVVTRTHSGQGVAWPWFSKDLRQKVGGCVMTDVWSNGCVTVT